MTGFKLNTPILIGDGTYKNIQDIQVNDLVMSYDEEAHSYIPQTVVAVTQPECDEVVKYIFSDGTEVYGCNELKFLTVSGEYKALEVGDQVIAKTVDGVATLLSKETIEGSDQLYELDIEDIDNFIVGNIVVHNGNYQVTLSSIRLYNSSYAYSIWRSTTTNISTGVEAMSLGTAAKSLTLQSSSFDSNNVCYLGISDDDEEYDPGTTDIIDYVTCTNSAITIQKYNDNILYLKATAAVTSATVVIYMKKKTGDSGTVFSNFTLSNPKADNYGFYNGTITGFATGLIPTNGHNRHSNASYYYSNGSAINANTQARGKLTFTVPAGATNASVTVTMLQYSEQGFDYGYLSNLDADWSGSGFPTDGQSTSTGTNGVAYTAYQKTASSSSTQLTYTYTNIPTGTHSFSFAYRKDGSASSNYDAFVITSAVLSYTIDYTVNVKLFSSVGSGNLYLWSGDGNGAPTLVSSTAVNSSSYVTYTGTSSATRYFYLSKSSAVYSPNTDYTLSVSGGTRINDTTFTASPSTSGTNVTLTLTAVVQLAPPIIVEGTQTNEGQTFNFTVTNTNSSILQLFMYYDGATTGSAAWLGEIDPGQTRSYTEVDVEDIPGDPMARQNIQDIIEFGGQRYFFFSADMSGSNPSPLADMDGSRFTQETTNYTITWKYRDTYSTWTTVTESYSSGTIPSRTLPSTVTSGNERLVATGWDDLSAVTSDRTITAQYKKQYSVTISDTYSTANKTSGWLDENTVITWTARSNYSFGGSTAGDTSTSTVTTYGTYSKDPGYTKCTITTTNCSAKVNDTAVSSGALLKNGSGNTADVITFTANLHYAFGITGETTTTRTVALDNTTYSEQARRYIVVTATNQSKAYDGSKLSANNTASITRGSLAGGDQITYTCSGSTSAATAGSTGTKTVTVKDLKNSSGTDVKLNYYINYVSGTLTITQKAITVTAPTAKTDLVYNGGAQSLINAGSFSGQVSGESGTSVGTFTYKIGSAPSSSDTSIPSATNADTYTVYWNFTPNNNYTTASTTSGTVTVTIDAPAVTITAGYSKSVYLSTSSNATSGSPSGTRFNVGATVYGFATLNDNTAQYTYTAPSGWTLISGRTYRIGSCTVAATGNSISGDAIRTLNNYTVTFSATNGSWSSASIANVPYGTTWSTSGTTVTLSGSKGSSTYTKRATTVDYNVGDATISATSGTVTGNTTITGTTATSARTYTVKWIGADGSTALETDSNVAYNATLTYNGSTPTKASTDQYSYTFSAWKLGSTSGSTVTSGTTKNPGSTSSTTINIYATFTSSERSYDITVTKNTGISTIYYKVNGATSWSTWSSGKISAKYGSTVYWYATASTGYTGNSVGSASSPNSFTMGTSGTIAPTATVNSYTLTINVTGASYGTYTVSRTSSPLEGAATGTLTNGATIYHGDVLSGTASAGATTYGSWNITSVTAPTVTSTGAATSGNITVKNADSHTATLYYNTSNATGGTSLGSTAAGGTQTKTGLSFNTTYYTSAAVSRSRDKFTHAVSGTPTASATVSGNTTMSATFTETKGTDTGTIWSGVTSHTTAAQTSYTITIQNADTEGGWTGGNKTVSAAYGTAWSISGNKFTLGSTEYTYNIATHDYYSSAANVTVSSGGSGTSGTVTGAMTISGSTAYTPRTYTIQNATVTGGQIYWSTSEITDSGGSTTLSIPFNQTVYWRVAANTGYTRPTTYHGSMQVTPNNFTFSTTSANGNATYKGSSADTKIGNCTANSYTVTLDKNGGSANGSCTATYDSATLTNWSAVTRTGHSCTGYFTAASGGTKVIDASGNLQASVSGYTDANKKWIKASNVTLYAQWSINSYAVTIYSGTGCSANKTSGTYDYGTVITWTCSSGYAFDSSGTTTATATITVAGTYSMTPGYVYLTLSTTNCARSSGSTAGWYTKNSNVSTVFTANTNYSYSSPELTSTETKSANSITTPTTLSSSPAYVKCAIAYASGQTNTPRTSNKYYAPGNFTLTASTGYAWNTSGTTTKSVNWTAGGSITTDTTTPGYVKVTLSMTNCTRASGNTDGQYVAKGTNISTTFTANTYWSYASGATRSASETKSANGIQTPTTLSSSPAYVYGTVTYTNCTGNYTSGHYLAPGTVTATANTNYRFTAASNTKTGTWSENCSLSFSPAYGYVTVNTSTGTKLKSGTSGTGWYSLDTANTTTYQVTDSARYTFNSTKTTSTTEKDVAWTASAGKTVSAPTVYTRQYAVTVSKTNCTADKATGNLDYGTVITFTATSGYAYDANGTTTETKTVTAAGTYSSSPTYARLTISATNCTCDKSSAWYKIADATSVTATFTPSTGYSFAKGATQTSYTATAVTMNQPRTVSGSPAYVIGKVTCTNCSAKDKDGAAITSGTNYYAPAGTVTVTANTNYRFTATSATTTGTWAKDCNLSFSPTYGYVTVNAPTGASVTTNGSGYYTIGSSVTSTYTVASDKTAQYTFDSTGATSVTTTTKDWTASAGGTVAAPTIYTRKYTITWKYHDAYSSWTTATESYNYGATPSRTLPSTVTSGNTRLVATSWDSLATVTAARTITANYKTQYNVTFTNTYSTADKANGWYDSGTTITWTANTNYSFGGSSTGDTSTSTITTGGAQQKNPGYVKCTFTNTYSTADRTTGTIYATGTTITWTANTDYSFGGSSTRDTSTSTVALGTTTYVKNPGYVKCTISGTHCSADKTTGTIYAVGTTITWTATGSSGNYTYAFTNANTSALAPTTTQSVALGTTSYSKSAEYLYYYVTFTTGSYCTQTTSYTSGQYIKNGNSLTWKAKANYSFAGSATEDSYSYTVNGAKAALGTINPGYVKCTISGTNCSANKTTGTIYAVGTTITWTATGSSGNYTYGFGTGNTSTLSPTTTQNVALGTTSYSKSASTLYYYITFTNSYCTCDYTSGSYIKNGNTITWTADANHSFGGSSVSDTSTYTVASEAKALGTKAPGYTKCTISGTNCSANKTSGSILAVGTTITWTADSDTTYKYSFANSTVNNPSTTTTQNVTLETTSYSKSANYIYYKMTLAGSNTASYKVGNTAVSSGDFILNGSTITWTASTATNTKYSYTNTSATTPSTTATHTVSKSESVTKNASYIYYNVTITAGTNCTANYSSGYILNGTTVTFTTTTATSSVRYSFSNTSSTTYTNNKNVSSAGQTISNDTIYKWVYVTINTKTGYTATTNSSGWYLDGASKTTTYTVSNDAQYTFNSTKTTSTTTTTKDWTAAKDLSVTAPTVYTRQYVLTLSSIYGSWSASKTTAADYGTTLTISNNTLNVGSTTYTFTKNSNSGNLAYTFDKITLSGTTATSLDGNGTATGRAIRKVTLGTHTYSYDGNAKNPNGAYSGYSISGATNQTNVASNYTATASLAETTNSTWSDGTTANKSITWSITAIKATLPTVWTGDSVDFHNTATVTATGYVGGTIYYRSSTTSASSGYGSWSTTAPTRTAVGTTWVQCYIKADSNHTDSDTSSAVTITVNKVDDAVVKITTTARTYNGAGQVVASLNSGESHGYASYTIGVGTDTTNVNNVTWANDNTSISKTTCGTYYIWRKFTPDSSHSTSGTAAYVGSVTISQRATTTGITPSSTSFTYGNTASTYTYSDSNLVNGHKAKHGTSNAPSQFSKPGSFTVTATTLIEDASGNDVTDQYTVTNNSTTVTVNKRAITVTAPANANPTYNGSPQAYHTAGSTNAPSGGVAGGTFTYCKTSSGTYSGSLLTDTNYGTTYACYWKFAITSDYYTTTSAVSGNITTCSIARRATTTSITASATSFTYGGTAPTYTYSDSNLVSGHTATHGTSNAPTSSSNVGEYTVTATTVIKSGTTDVSSNYNITNNTVKVTVERASVGAKPTTSVSTTYTGASQNNGYTTPTGVNMTGNNSGTNAGTYTATYTPDGNHKWSDGTTGSVTVTLTIGKANSSITLSSTTASIYTGATCNVSSYVTAKTPSVDLTYKIKTNGTTTASTINGATVTAGAMSSANDTNQSVVVTITNPGNDNYNSSTKDFTITVKKNVYTLSFSNSTTSVTYGDTLSVAATCNPSATISYATSGNYTSLNGSTLTGTKYSESNKDTITASVGRTTTYAAKSITRQVSVTQRAVTYKAVDQSKAYDGSVLSADNSISLVSGSLLSGHTATGSCTGSTSAASAGSTGTKTLSSVTIKSGTTDVTDNYVITKQNGNLSISKKAITVTAANKSKTYGDANPTLTASVTSGSLVTSSDLGTISATTTATASSAIGDYDITPTYTANNNYNVTSVKGTLTIGAKAVTYKASNQSKTYDGSVLSANNTIEKTAGALVSGHTATGSCTGATSAATAGSSATKTLSSVTIKDGNGTDVTSNYTITKQNGTLTINRAPGKATPSTTSKSYTSPNSSTVTAPSQSNNLKYNGATQSPTWSPTTYASVSGGTTSATEAGSYNQTAALKNTAYFSGNTSTFTVSVFENATVTATSSDTNVVTTSVSTTSSNKATVTLTYKKAGTATITLGAAQTTNYTAGSGSVSITLNNGKYIWTDGTTANKTVSWSISPCAYINDGTNWQPVKSIYIWNGSAWVLTHPELL